MSLKIYIDTNIFLDSVLDRDDGISKEILYFIQDKGFEIVLNDISIINIHYFARKGLEPKGLKKYINVILDNFTIVSADKLFLKQAINSDFKDFEDAVQYFCAKSIDADLIITNDKKGFKNSTIDTITSKDFYNSYIN
ncbi:hypothetical protein CSA08_04390 [Candidatus Gracilibacteria bacterium]|nr:MAG: hypothetical protein CSA08_04390 [Candidatus Gracilibacteria bacterium]